MPAAVGAAIAAAKHVKNAGSSKHGVCGAISSDIGGFSSTLGAVVAAKGREAEDSGVQNAFSDFKEAQGFAKKNFDIEQYLEEEPGVDPLELAKMDVNKSKDDVKAEKKAKKAMQGNVKDLFIGLRDSSKSWKWKSWRLAVFSESYNFKMFFISLVCLNGILIGIQADHASESSAWIYLETIFVTLFTVEIVIKLLGMNWLFFTDAWNVIDFVIVGVSVAQLIMTAILNQSSTGISSVRLVRIFRIIRVIGFVARLNLLVQAFIMAMQSVAWVGVLLIMMIYIAAVLARGFFQNATSPELDGKFTSIPMSMATLFQVLTMDGWASGIAFPIGQQYPHAWVFFVGFVLLGSFGLLNLLTGVFIEALMEITRANDKDAQKAMEKQRRHLITLISSAFKQTDEDCGGTLDQQELPVLLGMCKDYQDMLDFVGLDYPKMERACRIADYDHSERSYWSKLDDNGEEFVSVHHERYRPPPPEDSTEFIRMEDGDEGVLEGELVECLTHMDDPTTVADYYALMKRLRQLEQGSDAKMSEMKRQMDVLEQGIREILKRQDKGDWEPTPPPDPEPRKPPPAPAPAVDKEVLPEREGELASSMPDVDKEVLPESEREFVSKMFDRYDLDGSGTINSETELRQLVTNMLYKTGADPEVTSKMTAKVEALKEEIDWDLDDFMQWFDASKAEVAAVVETPSPDSVVDDMLGGV